MIHLSISKLKSISEFVRSSEWFSFVNYNVPLLINYIDADPLLFSYIQNNIVRYPEIYTAAKELAKTGLITSRENSEKKLEFYQFRVTEIKSYEEYVVFCYGYLKESSRNKGRFLTDNFLTEKNTPHWDRREEFYNNCILPLVNYLDIQSGSQSNALNIIYRYKILCEWYDRDIINKLDEIDLTKHHLSKFLFSEGFTYVFSETNTPSGRIDNFAFDLKKEIISKSAHLPYLIVAEGKIFNGRTNAIQIVKNQIYNRCNELNLTDGYCVIYNKTNKIIKISNASGEYLETQYLIQGNKIIYFLFVNLDRSFYESKEINKVLELIIE